VFVDRVNFESKRVGVGVECHFLFCQIFNSIF
jgi:hypothetical protein